MFAETPSLPLDSDLPSVAEAHEGRRRLPGAFSIRIDRIQPDKNQPRKNHDDAAQREFNDSIRQMGILEPITVRFDQSEKVFRIIAGERRYRAALELGLAEMPCWERTPKNEDVLLHQIAENWQRAELHPYDIADALARLRDSNGYTQKRLAELTGKPESEISRLLSLLKLDPQVQQEARNDSSGFLTKRHLLAVAHVPAAQQQTFLRTVKDAGMTAIETERLVRANKSKTERPGSPPAHRFRYVTTKAVVTVAFRAKNAPTADVLAALDEARKQAEDLDKRTKLGSEEIDAEKSLT